MSILAKDYTITILEAYVPRMVAQWEQGDLTLKQVANNLVMQCVFTILEFPAEVETVERIISTIPVPVWTCMAEVMQELPTPDGRWNWPPGGALVKLSEEAYMNPNYLDADRGLVAWKTPLPEVQTAIRVLQECFLPI